jgi:hypothetical protein
MAAQDSPDSHSTPPVADDEYGFAGRSRDQLRAAPAVLADQYVIVMIQPDRPSADPAEAASLEAAIEAAVRAQGGGPVSLPPAWVPEAAEGWRATYDEAVDVLLIDMPRDVVFYKGPLSASTDWVLGAIAAESVILITGPIPTPDEAGSVLESGRTSQIRIPLQVKVAR